MGQNATQFADLVGHAAQPFPVLLQRLVIRVGGIALHHGHHRLRTDEPGQIIDVTMRVVAGPDGFFTAS